jgi:hypothetical protein
MRSPDRLTVIEGPAGEGTGQRGARPLRVEVARKLRGRLLALLTRQEVDDRSAEQGRIPGPGGKGGPRPLSQPPGDGRAGVIGLA